MSETVDAAAAALKAKGVHSLPPLAIVLGSGLGAFAKTEPADPGRQALEAHLLASHIEPSVELTIRRE